METGRLGLRRKTKAIETAFHSTNTAYLPAGKRAQEIRMLRIQESCRKPLSVDQPGSFFVINKRRETRVSGQLHDIFVVVAFKK